MQLPGLYRGGAAQALVAVGNALGKAPARKGKTDWRLNALRSLTRDMPWPLEYWWLASVGGASAYELQRWTLGQVLREYSLARLRIGLDNV